MLSNWYFMLIKIESVVLTYYLLYYTANALCVLVGWCYRHTLRICNTSCFCRAIVVKGTRLSVRRVCTLPGPSAQTVPSFRSHLWRLFSATEIYVCGFIVVEFKTGGHRNVMKYRIINRLTPNDPYMGRTAPLTSKRCILYIYSTNISTEYFKHALYSPFFLFKMQFVS